MRCLRAETLGSASDPSDDARRRGGGSAAEKAAVRPATHVRRQSRRSRDLEVFVQVGGVRGTEKGLYVLCL